MIGRFDLVQAAHWIAARVRAALRDDSGAAVMEFAISLPLLVMMVTAGTGTAIIIHAQFGIQAAAREGASIGAYTSSSIDPYDTAIDAARAGAERVMVENGLDPTRAVIDFTGTPTDLQRGGLFQVQIDYTLELPIPMARYLGRPEGGSISFVVGSVAVVPIQKYKARWPCPSDDPICN